MDHSEAIAELRKPLDKRHVKPPSQYGPKGDYIEAWHAQAEANRIFGEFDWCQEVTETKCVSENPRKIGKAQKDGWGVTYTAKVRITVEGTAREDFGAGHGYDLDLGLAHESAIKEAVSDAMKRALKSFGNPFGLALYDKTRANVADGAAEERREEEAARAEADKAADEAKKAAAAVDWADTVAGKLDAMPDALAVTEAIGKVLPKLTQVWGNEKARAIVVKAIEAKGARVEIRDAKPFAYVPENSGEEAPF